MIAFVKHDSTLDACGKRIFSFRLTVLCLVITCSGCSTFSRSVDSKSLSAASSLDAKSLATSQAALALNRAELAEQQDKKEEAIRLYEQARALDPKLAHLSRRLAVLYDQRGDNARARAAYEHALQLEPRNADLLNDFGVYYLHREDWATAEKWLHQALDVDPTHQRATNNLAMSLAMQNRLNESYEAFSRVVGPAAAYSNLGVLMTRQNRHDKAREYFQRALVLDRTVRPAGEFLSRLDCRNEEAISSASNPSVQPVSYQPEVHH